MSLPVHCRVVVAVVLVTMAAGCLPVLAQTVEYELLAGSSEVGFEGASTLHDFTGRTTQVSGRVRFDPRDPGRQPRAHIEVQAASLDTDNKGRDRQMYKRLETDRYPLIAFDLEDFELGAREDAGSLSGIARGTISIHGVSRPLAMEVTLLPEEGDGWKVVGRADLEMPAFSIKPPRVLGFIKVDPRVTIFIALHLEPHS
ncbi:MAG: YceI family protein [Acidobacteriota bacterium]|nr:YceI family protein [Acidobacteriota bacterium]